MLLKFIIVLVWILSITELALSAVRYPRGMLFFNRQVEFLYQFYCCLVFCPVVQTIFNVSTFVLKHLFQL